MSTITERVASKGGAGGAGQEFQSLERPDAAAALKAMEGDGAEEEVEEEMSLDDLLEAAARVLGPMLAQMADEQRMESRRARKQGRALASLMEDLGGCVC